MCSCVCVCMLLITLITYIGFSDDGYSDDERGCMSLASLVFLSLSLSIYIYIYIYLYRHVSICTELVEFELSHLISHLSISLSLSLSLYIYIYIYMAGECVETYPNCRCALARYPPLDEVNTRLS